MILQDPPTLMPKDTVLDALKVLVGKYSNTQHCLFFSCCCLMMSLINVLCFSVDVRNHPILIHCKAGKVIIIIYINPFSSLDIFL